MHLWGCGNDVSIEYDTLLRLQITGLHVRVPGYMRARGRRRRSVGGYVTTRSYGHTYSCSSIALEGHCIRALGPQNGQQGRVGMSCHVTYACNRFPLVMIVHRLCGRLLHCPCIHRAPQSSAQRAVSRRSMQQHNIAYIDSALCIHYVPEGCSTLRCAPLRSRASQYNSKSSLRSRSASRDCRLIVSLLIYC